MVIPRAIVRDMHTGVQAARLMSLLMLVFSISPILAPLTGSAVITFYGWRGVFWAVMIAAFIGLVLLATQLNETRLREHRAESGLRSAMAAYGLLLRDKNFLTLTFIGGLGISSFLVYLANSPFVLIDYYGLTPTQYSVAFSINAVSFFTVSQATGWFWRTFRPRPGHAHRRDRLCADHGGDGHRHEPRLQPASGHGRIPVRRLWLPRPRHPDERGAGAGGSRRRLPERHRR